MMTLQEFYKSKAWEAFRMVVISNRTNPDGFVHCAVCGKPILKPYDLIVHHKQELNEANVNDAMISLNPDNVECVHFRCHNKLHERFGYNKTSAGRNVRKHVYIVYGSPCAGKSTWVHENATQNDLIVDLDNIWQMISINERYVKPVTLRSVVFQMRDAMYDVIRYRSGKWHNAYIITGGALKGDRDRLMQRLAADDCIFIDTSQKECINRAILRDLPEGQLDEWIKYINNWFETYQPDELSDN